MGGQSVKRRREAIEAWACKNAGSDLVLLNVHRQKWYKWEGRWCGFGSTLICRSIFRKLTGRYLRLHEILEPVRVRIPAWTVLDGGKLKGGA